MKYFILLSALAPLSAFARTFTVTNKCPYTVWPAIFTDLHAGSAKPDAPTGWEAPPGSSKTFKVPDNWKSGRIWGRRGCDFRKGNGPTACLSGGCNGGLLCDPHTGTGVPPASLAEWTLSTPDGNDYYDVSLVDGFNVPMTIENNKGCPVSDCPVDLNVQCPNQLKGPKDGKGQVVGCNTACNANLDGHQANSANCCSGSHNTPQTCPSSGVQFYSYFHGKCPNAYAYAYDDHNALKMCSSKKAADYHLIFCPGQHKRSDMEYDHSQFVMRAEHHSEYEDEGEHEYEDHDEDHDEDDDDYESKPLYGSYSHRQAL